MKGPSPAPEPRPLPDGERLLTGARSSIHAISLAIVAWYLMIPPIDATNKVDANAPMITWRKSVKFDSRDQCVQSLKDVIEHPTTPAEYQAAAKDTLKAKMRPLSQAEMNKRMKESQCVAEDDPRIKPKAK